MPLSIVTNTSAMMVRTNLNSSTDLMTQAIERMTTGYKVNNAKDDAAGYNIIDTMTTKIGSYDMASNNAQIGIDMLTTTEENYALITEHLQRVRDLTEQAANGTYSSDSLVAIRAEIEQRLEEIDRIARTAEYNGMYLMTDGADNTTAIANDIRIQVGLYGNGASGITLIADELFSDATVQEILGDAADALATQFAGVQEDGTLEATNPSQFLSTIDDAITNIASRITTLGAAQNRLESAMSAIDTNITQLNNSRTTMRDADIAEESTNYISAQILQQAAATLLSTANQVPSIALNLI